MPRADLVTDICIASAEEAMRFAHFVQGFLSRNGFPFVIIHHAPDLEGDRRQVVFEDPGVNRKFAQEWDHSQPAPGGA